MKKGIFFQKRRKVVKKGIKILQKVYLVEEKGMKKSIKEVGVNKYMNSYI